VRGNEKGTQYPGAYLGHPIPRGYKYGDLALQVRGVSRIGTIKYGLETRETALTRTSSNKITKPQLPKENFKDQEKLVAGPRWVPDTKTVWPNDYRS
jgi:hypothetical protein